jgi:hypothetical protein
MDNFIVCPKCRLSVPRHRTVPVQAKINGQIKMVLICAHHLEENQKENHNDNIN